MRRLSTVGLIAVMAILALAANARSSPDRVVRTKSNTGTTTVALPVPPRFMWGWGAGLRGYCGSVSFQSFGLLYGNYLSEEVVRDSADGHELLIASNDEVAANNLRFDYELWDYKKVATPQANAFLSWVANHIDDGHGVVGGFYERTNGGDPDYDHIMPIFGYEQDSSAAFNNGTLVAGKATTRSDILGIYYNDLYRTNSLYGNLADDFVRDRDACSAPGGIQPLAAPYEFCLPKKYDYGIALKGNRDDNGELVQARLEIPSWTEPDWGYEDQKHEAVVTFSGTLTVTGTKAGTKYTVLRFDNPYVVPVSSFAHGAFSKRFDFTADGTTHVLKDFDTFLSDATVFYRVVTYFAEIAPNH